MTEKDTPDNDIADTPSYKALKAVVIGLGILLVLGFAVVVATIGYRIANMGEDTPAEAGQGQEAATQGFESRLLARPAGAALVDVTLDETRILLHFRDEDGRETLVILDSGTGEETGRIEIPAQ